MPAIIDSVLRAGEGKILRKLKRNADQINSIEEDFAALSDAELRAMTDEFRQRHADGESLDDLLPEAFATVREAARRTLGHAQPTGGAAGGGVERERFGEIAVGFDSTVGRAGLARGRDRPVDQRPTAEVVRQLRRRRAHARATSSCEDHDRRRIHRV